MSSNENAISLRKCREGSGIRVQVLRKNTKTLWIADIRIQCPRLQNIRYFNL